MNSPFSQLGDQLGGIWKQLGVNQRVSLVLATLVVIGGLVGMMAWSSRVNYALLYGKLDDAEAAKVVAVLTESKTPYRTGPSGSIMVPADKVHTLRMQLASRGIPRGDGVGFEIFDKPNFGISDFVQRANYVRAVQGELARTIGQLDEIEAARVMIVMPENRLLTDNTRRPTASVFVKLKAHAQLQPSAVNSIRFLVANAVEGLQVNFVSVVDNRGTVLSENQENDSIGGLSNSQLAARKNMEQYLAKKAEGMLEKVLGPGQAVVRVSAEINFDSLTRTEERFDPEGQVVRSSTVTDENTDSASSTAGPGGAPGVATNASTDTNNVAGGPQTNSKTKKKVGNTQYEINKTTSSSVLTAGGLKRVSAAVFVAAKMQGTGKDRKAAPRTEEELKKIRTIVRSALGIVENDATRRDEITLEEMSFNEEFGFEQVAKLETQQQRDQWMQIGQQVGYGAVALAVLFVFWRAFKSTAAESIPLGVPVGQLADASGSSGGDARPKPEMPVTVEALNRMVRENPENMTQAIRSWMTPSNPSQN
ncbi:MAG: flagellar M-ring protein FliF [Pedosphaera sp. Tous-C6FEB]|nr:MAG: flagellar M-ring protein FliF [Pedosphaera sp. Tous-C6FEB]